MSPWLSDLVLSSQSDERLVSLARAGYDRAFVAIFERYKRRLLAFAIQLGSGSRAEDVVQQAFLSAFAALKDQREVLHLSGWLHQTVRNTSIQMVGRVPAESALDADTLSAVNIEEHVQSRLEARAVLANLAHLPERQRSALIQTALAGESRSEIALSMGVSEGAVRQLVHRARATLRSAAAVLLPFPVVAWAARAGGRVAGAAPASAEIASGSVGRASDAVTSQLAPLTAGAVSTGGSLLVKTGAIIAATGLVATGVVVSHAGHRHGAAKPRRSAAVSIFAQAPGNRDGTIHSTPERPTGSRPLAPPTLHATALRRPMPLSSGIGRSRSVGRQNAPSDLVAGTGTPARTRSTNGGGHDGSDATQQHSGGSSSGRSGAGQQTSGSGGHDGSRSSTSGPVSTSGTGAGTGAGTSSNSGDGTSSSSSDGTSPGSSDGSATDSVAGSGDVSSGSSGTASFTGSGSSGASAGSTDG